VLEIEGKGVLGDIFSVKEKHLEKCIQTPDIMPYNG